MAIHPNIPVSASQSLAARALVSWLVLGGLGRF